MLTASHDAIDRAASEDLVLPGNGGPSSGDKDWYGRAFATAGAGRKYDISAINIRGKARDVAFWLTVWRRFLAQQGFKGPIWVVEHGYPADAAFQFDPAFTGGDAAQAAYLRRSLPDLEASGAAEVFVALRHRDTNPYVSEGIVDIGDGPGYPASRRPAFYVVRDWGNEWRARQATYRERAAWHAQEAHRQRAAATEADRRAKRAWRKARRFRRRQRSYLRRAKELRAAVRRHGLCFERTAAPACTRRAARARTGAKRAQGRAKKAGEACRRELGAATRYSRRAKEYRREAAANAFRGVAYARLIKPLL
jgi:hypothetical protein